jgi:hypothetical protein
VFIDASAIIAIFEVALGAAGNGMSKPHVGDFLEPAAVRTVADKEAHAAARVFLSPRQEAGPSRAARPRRPLRVCNNEEFLGDFALL